MKLTRTKAGAYALRLSKREKEVFVPLLQRYPVMPAGHCQLSKTAAMDDASQELLAEALREQRAQHRRQLEQLLEDKKRFKLTEQGWTLTLSAGDLEWLLQVLNDIRVGSWVLLGSPEALPPPLDEENVEHVYSMEVAGAFQSFILQALDIGG